MPHEEDPQGPKAEPVQKVEAVERALTILEAFADGSDRLSLRDITERTGFYRSTVLRLYASLNRFGYLNRDPDGAFRLGPTLLRLGNLYQSAFDLATEVRPVLARLAATTGETATFYIRRGDTRVCLYRHYGKRTIRHMLEEGDVLSIDRGASGRVLLAFSGEPGATSDAIRAAGHYVSMGERDPDLAGVAVPVFASGDDLAGALNISGPVRRFQDAEVVAQTLAVLKDEAATLTRRLGGSPAPPPQPMLPGR